MDAEYVLVMLDDFFLRKNVSNQTIEFCVQFAARFRATCVRLVASPGPTDTAAEGQNLIGSCDPDLPYRLSMQASIWNRQALRALLRPGESIWQFEHDGNARIRATNHGFYSVWKSVLPYEGIFSHHVVEKGRWLFHEKWIFRTKRIGCDFSARGTLSFRRTLVYHAARMIDRVLSLLPWRKKLILKAHLKAILRPIFKAQLKQLSGK
jgi:hypothetical protein